MQLERFKFFGKKRDARSLVIVLGCMTLAFIVGVNTAGEIHPVVSPLRASDTVLTGDLNGNGIIDIGDVRVAIEIAQGSRTPTPDELSADPDKDYQITFQDAQSIIELLDRTPAM